MAVELFRAYVFDAKDKSFLVPVLSSDRQSLIDSGHLLTWCLWNSHTTSSSSASLRHSYMTCCADDCQVVSTIRGSATADQFMNSHEVSYNVKHTIIMI